MPNYNKIIMAGHLTRDPELSYLPSGTALAQFGLAVSRRWSKDGQKKEEVCYVDCKCFGASAETIHKYVLKGAPILVEGRLEFQQWKAQDGTNRSRHTINVESFQFLGIPAGKAEPAPTKRQSDRQPEQQADQDQIDEDDIPF
jgi:single-strand DNA-binding protein